MRVHPNARSAARGGGGLPLRRDRRRSGARGLTRVVRCARARFRKRDVAAIGNTSERAPEAEGEIQTMKKQRRGLGLTLRVDPGKRSPITLTDHKKRIRKRKRESESQTVARRDRDVASSGYFNHLAGNRLGQLFGRTRVFSCQRARRAKMQRMIKTRSVIVRRRPPRLSPPPSPPGRAGATAATRGR